MAVTQGIETGRKRPAQDLGEAWEGRVYCFGGLVRIRHIFFVGSPCVFSVCLGFCGDVYHQGCPCADTDVLVDLLLKLEDWYVQGGVSRDDHVSCSHPNFG